MQVERFNVRVYGLCFTGKNELLISEESIGDFHFVKFPGGGLEPGEGLIAGLKRELKEEGKLTPQKIDHFYTTDFFQQSAFNPKDQIISVYYKTSVSPDWSSYETHQQTQGKLHTIVLKKILLSELHPEMLTFPIDRHVLELLKSESS